MSLEKLQDAQLVALILGVPAAITAITGGLGIILNRRGTKHAEKLAIEKQRADEDQRDHVNLRKDLEDAWARERSLREQLGASEQARLTELQAHREAIMGDQTTRHELRSIARNCLSRVEEHNEEAPEQYRIKTDDLRARLKLLYPPATSSE